MTISRFEQPARDEGPKPGAPNKRSVIEIRGGEVHVAERLPPGASLRIELAFEADSGPIESAEAWPEDAPRERFRAARGSSPPAFMREAREQGDAGRDGDFESTSGAGDGGEEDDLDFEEKPTFDLDRSELESLAKGGTLPLVAPPAAERVGNDIPPVSGTTEAAHPTEVSLPQPDDVVIRFEEDEHAGRVRQVLARPDGPGRRRFDASAATPAKRSEGADTEAATWSARDARRKRRERVIVAALTAALAVAVTAIVALVLGQH